MADVESKLNKDELFADVAYIPKEGVGLHGKRECLHDAISKGKVYLLGGENNGHMNISIFWMQAAWIKWIG